MKKLLILLLAAAVVGFIVSKTRAPAADEGSVGEGETAVALSEPEQPGQAAPAEAARLLSSTAPARSVAQPRPVSVPAARPVAAALPEQPATRAGARPAARAASAAPRPVVTEAARPAVGPDYWTRTFAQGVELTRAGELLKAREVLSGLYLLSNGQRAADVRKVLDEINADLVFNPRCVDGAEIHVVRAGETLTTIARQYGVSWRMIQRVNGMSSDRIKQNQKLKILRGPVSCVAFISEFRMAMFIGGVYAKEYPIGIGKDDKTPTGEFVVETMLVEPTWYKPDGGVVKYGQPGHLLGKRWIGFADEPGASGIGIHGTNDESSIGTKCSNGCIRMRNDDVCELYDYMAIGSRTTIRD
jgi:hypothetical protein